MDRPLKERRRYILEKENDMKGYDYADDPYIIECGKDDDLGFIFKAAPYVIYKRGGFGDWAQFAEIFGMPFLVGKYNGYDPKAKEQLFKALSEIGSNPRAAIPKETDLEVTENKSTGSNTLYKDLKDACNEEILIAVLGNLMTTLDGSSRSQSQVHKETQEDITKADRRYVRRVLNRKLVPLLIKRGYPAAGGLFSFPDQGESISTDERLDMALKVKGAGIPVDDDYIYEITGIPKAEKQAEPDPEPEPEPGPNKKKQKKKGLRNFFVKAPETKTGATQTNYWAKLMRSITGTVKLSDDYSINFNRLFNEALKEVYGGGTSPVNARLFDITNDALQHAFSVEFGKEDEGWGQGNAEWVQKIRQSGAEFSTYKAHTLTKGFIELVYDDKGNQKTFKQFKKDCQPLKDQDERHLPTQYNTALKTVRAGINYMRYLETEHIYPNLEYLVSLAEHKSEEHLEYVGTILPVRHKWWIDHLPPSRWNCQCRVKPTRKKTTAEPDDNDDIDPVFSNNPALSGKFIKYEETPYYKNADDDLRQVIEEFAKRAGKTRQRLTQLEFSRKNYRSGGYVDISAAGQNKNEEALNLKTYQALAQQYGEKYALLPVDDAIGKRNPDAVNLKTYQYSDAKHPRSKSGKSAIQNSIKTASGQKIAEVVIQLSQPVSYREIGKGLKASFQKGRAKTIKTVIIMDENGNIMKRYDAKKLRKLWE